MWEPRLLKFGRPRHGLEARVTFEDAIPLQIGHTRLPAEPGHGGMSSQTGMILRVPNPSPRRPLVPDSQVDRQSIAAVEFLRRWSASGAAERANYQLLLSELCDVIGVPRSSPATAHAMTAAPAGVMLGALPQTPDLSALVPPAGGRRKQSGPSEFHRRKFRRQPLDVIVRRWKEQSCGAHTNSHFTHWSQVGFFGGQDAADGRDCKIDPYRDQARHLPAGRLSTRRRSRNPRRVALSKTMFLGEHVQSAQTLLRGGAEVAAEAATPAFRWISMRRRLLWVA